jgi:hypothetical protein
MDVREETWIQQCVSRKVLSLVTPYGTYTRALTHENFCYSAVGQMLTPFPFFFPFFLLRISGVCAVWSHQRDADPFPLLFSFFSTENFCYSAVGQALTFFFFFLFFCFLQRYRPDADLFGVRPHHSRQTGHHCDSHVSPRNHNAASSR